MPVAAIRTLFTREFEPLVWLDGAIAAVVFTLGYVAIRITESVTDIAEKAALCAHAFSLFC